MIEGFYFLLCMFIIVIFLGIAVAGKVMHSARKAVDKALLATLFVYLVERLRR